VGGRAGAGRVGRISGESSPAGLRSSIQASLPGRAEGSFLGELGSAHTRNPGNQTAKFPEFSVGMGIVGLAWATKHIPSVVDAPFLLFWACTKAFSEPCSQIGQHK
jgi:hypothetical protein